MLIPWQGLYLRVALRSSLALKSTDIVAGVIDIDYRGNLKVVIMNHSVDIHLHIKPGDCVARFILTRYETPEVVEIIKVDATDRGSAGFGSNG